MRLRKPSESSCQSRLCRKTRMVFIPNDSAHPSSRSIVGRSKVSACHISNSLTAVLGMKLLPMSHGCWEYQSFACFTGHLPSAAELNAEAIITKAMPPNRTISFFAIEFPMEFQILIHYKDSGCFTQNIAYGSISGQPFVQVSELTNKYGGPSGRWMA